LRLDSISPSLFSPLASKNARLYGIGLQALYQRLVEAREAGDECTSKEAKAVIRRELFNEAQGVQWQAEEDDGLVGYDSDTANRIYNRLKDTGWLLELEEIGYRKTTSFTTIGAQLLSAIESAGGQKELEFGTVCRGVLSSLENVLVSPRENAQLVSFSAKSANTFYSEVTALSFVTREIAHQMMEQSKSADQLRTFFKDFFGDVFLKDYRSLHGRDNPTRYKGRILKVAAEINYEKSVMTEMVQGILEQRGKGSPEDIEREIRKDLVAIDRVFTNILALLESMERYRRTMTRRTHDAIEYSFNAIPDISDRIDALVSQLSTLDGEAYPARTVGDRYVSPARLTFPREPIEEVKATRIQRPPPPLKEIAFRKVEARYLRRRADNPVRLKRYLDKHLGTKSVLTSCELPIETLDDLLAYLEVRKLMAASHLDGHIFNKLTKEFSVVVVPGMVTENAFVSAPQLEIRRRPNA